MDQLARWFYRHYQITNTGVPKRCIHIWLIFHIVICIHLFGTFCMLRSNSQHQSPSWETNSHSTGQKLLAFYGTWRFMAVFRRGRHRSYPEADESSPHPHILLKIRFNIILSPNVATNGQHSCCVFGRSWIQIPVRRPAILTEGFSWISSVPPRNVGIVP
jgi:hypothetical protein